LYPFHGYKNAIADELDDATAILDSFHVVELGTQAVDEVRRRIQRDTTGRANNGGTEAINGLIELHRRVARCFRNRDHYRLRMFLIGGGLSHPHLK